MKKLFLTLMLALMCVGVAHATIKTQEINYVAGDLKLKGYLAFDDALDGKRPAVIVVHEWWGQNDEIRRRAKMLAELGYVGFAIDMYGNGKSADHPKEAGAFMNSVLKLKDVGQSRFQAALEILKQQPQVDTEKIAAIGYSFGGAVVLNMARMGEDLKGVVSFYGNLSSTIHARPDSVKAKIFVCNGAADQFVSQNDIEHFKKEMTEAKADLQFKSYEGAKHGFTNPASTENGKKFSLPLAYSEKADQDSWEDMKAFLKSVLK